MVSFNKRLTRVLEESEALTPEQLTEAAKLSEQEDVSLSSVVVKNGWMEEKEILGLVASRLRFPPLDLRSVSPSPEVLESIPQDLASYYGVLPISKIGNILTLAVSNPYDVVKLDDIRIVTGCDLRLVLALQEALKDSIDKAYNPGEHEMAEILEGITEADVELKEQTEDEGPSLSLEDVESGESPAVKLVNMVIYQAVKERASDIHIEPMEKRIRVRFRNDGILRETFSPPRRMLNSIVSRIKIMADLDIAEKRRPQDGKFQIRIENRQVDFRVSVLPLITGEKVVLRILDAGNLALKLDNLGFEQQALDDFRAAVNSPYGMLLVTGPTGSGKSTTLYSAVKEVLTVSDNFVTVEDPVEYQLEGVNQVQVRPKAGLTFAGSLRSILRQDPDVVMIGEIRDSETIEIAVKAALTGHLVLSTLHTNDAPSTITRMVDMGVDPFMVASSTLLVSAQRLCRRLCAHCKEEVEAPPERLLRVGFTEEEVNESPTIFMARGCTRCNQGYAGRFAILETLPMSEDTKRIIIEGGSALDIRHQALEEGMITLRRCALLNAMRGNTSIEEVLRVTLDDRRIRAQATDEEQTELT
ncbi:MAG: GspE/PulE family protein [Planctomycetota bacterium]|jgi:type IV pilus assembly protein PilB